MSDASMIERVALALLADEHGPDLQPNDVPNLWPAFVQQARVAIAAMRKPTEDMVSAGLDADVGHYSATGVWEAMIDAALGEV